MISTIGFSRFGTAAAQNSAWKQRPVQAHPVMFGHSVDAHAENLIQSCKLHNLPPALGALIQQALETNSYEDTLQLLGQAVSRAYNQVSPSRKQFLPTVNAAATILEEKFEDEPGALQVAELLRDTAVSYADARIEGYAVSRAFYGMIQDVAKQQGLEAAKAVYKFAIELTMASGIAKARSSVILHAKEQSQNDKAPPEMRLFYTEMHEYAQERAQATRVYN